MPQPRDPPIFLTPEATCPTCGARLNGTGPMDTPSLEPRPGDVTVCIPCGELLTFCVVALTPHLYLRRLTEPERRALQADPAWAQVRRALDERTTGRWQRVCLQIVGRWSMEYPDETPRPTPFHQEEPHGP